MKRRAGDKISAWRHFSDTLPLLLLVFLFGILIVLGSFIDSNSYSLNTSIRPSSQPSLLVAFVMKVLTWTWSNIALLACLAALIGEFGRVALTKATIALNPRAALIRGFFVFLVVLGGQLVLVGKISTGSVGADNIRQEYYLRVAGFVSLLGFLVGYRPRLFLEILRRMQLLASKGNLKEETSDKEDE